MARPTPGALIPRRRTRLPLDGNIAGVHFTHYHGGRHYASAPIGLGAPPPQYDPGRAFYAGTAGHYTPPDPWFEHLHVRPTPMIRTSGAFSQAFDAFHEREFDQGQMTPALMEQILEDMRREEEQFGLSASVGADGLGPPAFEPAGGQVLSPHVQQAVPAMEQAYLPGIVESEQLMADAAPEFDSEPVMPMPMEPAPPSIDDAVAPDAGVGGLEQIVDQAMPGFSDPMAQAYNAAMMTPELFDQAMHEAGQQMTDAAVPEPAAPMQALYDEQLAMLMDPYALPDPRMPAPGVMPDPLAMPGMGPPGPM